MNKCEQHSMDAFCVGRHIHPMIYAVTHIHLKCTRSPGRSCRRLRSFDLELRGLTGAKIKKIAAFGSSYGYCFSARYRDSPTYAKPIKKTIKSLLRDRLPWPHLPRRSPTTPSSRTPGLAAARSGSIIRALRRSISCRPMASPNCWRASIHWCRPPIRKSCRITRTSSATPTA